MASVRNNSSILIVMILLSFGFHAYSDTGIGTINDPPYLPSSCYGYQDAGVMIAAANEALFQGGAACGKYFQVTCIGGTNLGTPHPCTSTPTVTVLITDLCPPPGCKGDLDLSHESFSAIADPAAGGIKISYQEV
ncbi:Barwin-like endoglucanase [Artemisia annua]|uniref:Barwin-like endoglucanase n=1 Tax=Artemisia annua TaxID=35608 RepID=A0A2U1PD49_ARTAN|nr:Barwin-like endoglucanase [Artemisia annua]